MSMAGWNYLANCQGISLPNYSL